MIRIETAAVSDAPEITRLFEALITEITDRTKSPQPLFSLSGTEEKCTSFIESDIYAVLLARDDASGETIGFLSLCESHSLYASGTFGIIQECYVQPDYRSQGVGARLLSAAQHYGQALGWKRLEVATPPLPVFHRSASFYEQHGFERTGGAKLKFIIL